jgi:hypothetical protein
MNDFWTAFSAVIAASTIIGGAYCTGLSIGYRRASRDFNFGRARDRFDQIYAPLYGLFTTCHITTVSARGAPYLRQRVRNAFTTLIDERRALAAVKALFDKQELGPSGEVEYGENFPRSEIAKCLRNKERYADPTLLNLVARSNRSQYEEMLDECQLTEADLRLFKHICSEYEKLGKRFAKT